MSVIPSFGLNMVDMLENNKSCVFLKHVKLDCSDLQGNAAGGGDSGNKSSRHCLP